MNEIRKIVRQTLLEYITPKDLKNVENYADELFSDVGVDVAFTNHFLDRVNDLRNKQDITPEELKWLYQKAHDRYADAISKLPPGQERVLTDPDTQINIPFAMNWDGKSPNMDMVGKTVMRKKDFKSHTPKLQLEEVIEEAIGRIKKIKLNGIYYHGTAVQAEDDLFSEFNPGYSDWDATWFSSDENIAEEFADTAGRDDSETTAIYRVKLQCAPVADIDYEQTKRMIEDWELNDFREVVSILTQKGFRGWKTTGSIGSLLYDDIAIFNTNCVHIQDIKLFLNGQWTEYMSLDQAQEFVNSHREKQTSIKTHENIDVPINIGDEVLGGKFLNKKTKVKTIKKDGKGDITINDKPLLKVRIPKENLDETSVKKDERVDIYRDSSFIVVRPLSEKASCKYGAFTKWCISAPSSGAWDEYNSNIIIIMILQKNYQLDSDRQLAISKMLDYNDAADNNEVTPEMRVELKNLTRSNDTHYFEDLSKIALVFQKNRNHIEIWDANNINITENYNYNFEKLPISNNVKSAIENYVDSIKK